MARVQYGTIVTEIKGKIAGQVFQGGNVGHVLRNKGYTAGNSTSLRFTSTSRLSSITTAWKTLTDAQRASWAALIPTWLFTNKFGVSYQGSAFQIFTAYNMALAVMEEGFFDVPTASATPDNPGLMTFSTSTTASLKFNIANVTVHDDNILLYASPPVSAGRNGNKIKMLLMDVFDYSIAGPFDFRTQYLKAYGTYPAGTKIFIKTVCRNGAYPYPHYTAYANAIIT